MKKKLTIVINALQGGGAERVAVTVANYLVQNGYEVNFTVMNLYDSVHQNQLDKRVNLINLNVRHARGSFIAFRRFLKLYNPEKILVFNHELAVVLLILRILLHKKYILIARNINTLSENKKHEQSIWHKYFKDVIIKFLYKKVDRIIAQSVMMKDDLIVYYKIPAGKIEVINNPVSLEFEQINESDHRLSVKANELLFVGRLEKQKGLQSLFDALKLIIIREPHIVLRILGGGSLKEELIQYADSIGVTKFVIFEGFQKDLMPFYKQARLTVLSSLFEGFPNVLVESISCGTPVVAFDCKSGPAEIIDEGVNGFLIEYLNTRQMAEKIIEGLHKKWDRTSIRNTALRFSPENIINKYINIITEQSGKNEHA